MADSSASRRALIVGCGQLGSRHLQALASLPILDEIEVVDPRPEALALGQRRLEELSDRQPGIRLRWLSSLDDATREGALCVVATQAKPRCQIVQYVARQLGYSAFLLEKVVGQSVQEIEELAGFARGRGVSAWVNCKTRAYPIHQRAKARLDPREPILLSATGGNHGLANNGIHAADLFAFYDETERIALAGSSIDAILHPSKRGADVFDLSGALCGQTAKGSRFVLTYAAGHLLSEQIVLTSRGYRLMVDHLQRWAVESSEATGWAWRPVSFEGDLTVSCMTRAFASGILTHGDCALPTLDESLVAHRFILGSLAPHFSRMLDQAVDACPVT